jgi:hypothetical protein
VICGHKDWASAIDGATVVSANVSVLHEICQRYSITCYLYFVYGENHFGLRMTRKQWEDCNSGTFYIRKFCSPLPLSEGNAYDRGVVRMQH